MYITLRTYDNYINANLALGKLLDGGIHAFLQDEHTVTMDPLLSIAINGIKLVVPEREAPTASAMLGIIEDEYKNAVECPACTCTDIDLIQRPTGLGGFLRGIYKLLTKRDLSEFKDSYRCNRCGFEFEDVI
jgi:hypothetical protein